MAAHTCGARNVLLANGGSAMKTIVWGIVLFTLVAVSGCSQALVKYQCADGSFVNTANACPPVSPRTDCPQLNCATCPSNTVMKYQCADGSVQDAPTNCPQVPEATNSAATSKAFTGDSSTVTDKLYLNQGLVILNATYAGTSNFEVDLIDDAGNQYNVVNTAGSYDGTTSYTISTAGYYRLSVQVGTSFTGGAFSNTAKRTLYGAGKPRAAHDCRTELVLAILQLYSTLTASCGQESIFSRDPGSVTHRSRCRRQENFRASKMAV